MKALKVSFDVSVFESFESLPKEDQLLMEAAISARKIAYAPYSNFCVGAAVLMANGEIITGSNQENASYPSGLCAERVAVFHSGSKFPNVRIIAIAISAASKNHVVKSPVAPCGSCRQSISEYENKQNRPIGILFMGETGEVFKCGSIADLLPFAFNGAIL